MVVLSYGLCTLPLLVFAQRPLKSIVLANIGQLVASVDALLTCPISIFIAIVNPRSGLYRSFCTSSLPIDSDTL